MLDKRCKYKLREVRQFYIFIRDKRNHIYYVRYRDGRTISTGKTTLSEAYNFAQVFFNSHKKTVKKSDKLALNSVLNEYYCPGSIYTDYDLKHGAKYTDKILSFNHHRMQIVAGLLSDIEYPEQLTRNRLIKLQDQLLKKGLSGKTVNNYMSLLHKIFRQLLDKEIISTDPFTSLRPCSFTKELRLCFPLDKMAGAFKNLETKYDVLAFCACATGLRRSELDRIQADDFITKNGTEWLNVRGTKSIYSVRTVPVFKELKDALIRMSKYEYSCHDYAKSVSLTGQKIGLDDDYIQKNGIKFHSFRKMYKTLLTQANLNTSLVETLMGHTTQNQMSNDVERIYFVAESADLSKVHTKVVAELKYLIVPKQ